MEPLAEVGRARSLPSQQFGSGRMAEILRGEELLHPLPFDPLAGPHGDPRGDRDEPAQWSLDFPDPEDLISTRLAPRQLIERGQRVVSIVLRPKDLKAILKNPARRGLDTERPAYVSFFDQGELVFADGFGLRIHGGLSRIHSPEKSFRLYCHRNYGAEAFPPGLLPWAEGPETRVVLHNDTRADLIGRNWSFANPLAYDIARRIGALAPHTAPAQLVLNGEVHGAVFLTERLDERYLEKLLGHGDFIFIRTKKTGKESRYRRGRAEHYRKLRSWIEKAPKITLEEAGQRVDLDNLFRWLISVTFCATTDAFQGPMVRDEADPHGRWFWINWDMDHSFMSTKEELRQPWVEDTFDDILRGNHPDLRGRLLRRLLRDDPEARVRLRQLYEEVLETRLTDEFLQERYEHYSAVAAQYEICDTDFLPLLESFLTHRRVEVQRQLRLYLETH